MKITELETERLLLRQWKESDFKNLAILNSDPEVMEYYPTLLSREESDAMGYKFQALLSEKGWGFWAVELKNLDSFIGFAGLHTPKQSLPFSPCVEICWRLLKPYWGNGYATEAAKATLKFTFETLGLTEIVAFTTVLNSRSRSVMERLGFGNTFQNFSHPDIPPGHPLSEHVLYKLTRSEWQSNGLNPGTN